MFPNKPKPPSKVAADFDPQRLFVLLVHLVQGLLHRYAYVLQDETLCFQYGRDYIVTCMILQYVIDTIKDDQVCYLAAGGSGDYTHPHIHNYTCIN